LPKAGTSTARSGGDQDIACKREREPDARGRAVDRGDEEFVCRGDGSYDAAELTANPTPAIAGIGRIRSVSDSLDSVADHVQLPARREGWILASEDHRPHRRIGGELVKVLLQLQGQSRTQGIQTLGIAKGENYPLVLPSP
jgi:hypothetical protein